MDGLTDWHETALAPQIDLVRLKDELHPKFTSAGQTIGKLQSRAVGSENVGYAQVFVLSPSL